MISATKHNPRRRRRLQWALGIAVGVIILAGTALLAGYLHIKAGLPTIRSLADYTPPQTTRIYSDDGYLVGRIARQRRTVVPVDAMPPHVVHAFLAAEDAAFYEHEGLDYIGILRAAIKNLRPGAHLQGASTITQQTVKTMVVGNERSYTRKMREAILARELEQMLSKDDILHIYLNQIYFGAGAYGVEAAARTYFGKSVREVSLGEAAYLASMPKNPSYYTPRANPSAAKRRQRYVLKQMLANGWADAEAVRQAVAAPVPRPPEPPPYWEHGNHYVEHVRRLLIARYGKKAVYEGGLTVYTGMHAKSQSAAEDALRRGLETRARQHGYAGASARISTDRLPAVLAALRRAFDGACEQRQAQSGLPDARRWIWDLRHIEPQAHANAEALAQKIKLVRLTPGARVVGVVTRIDAASDRAWVDLGRQSATLTLQSMRWARPFAPNRWTRPPDEPGDILQRGDLVPIRIADTFTPTDTQTDPVPAELLPIPQVEGALVAVDPHTRLVRALVGGYDQTPGNLLRAVQSQRQPGSAFKPIVYAAGIAEKVITPASICPDSPVVIRDPWTGEAWKPKNYEDDDFDGNITYRQALTRSKNTCSVKLIEKLKPQPVIDMARRMGIQSRLPENLTLALGSGDVKPLDLANAYATLASAGRHAEPIFVRKVVDARGRVLTERDADLEQVLDPAVAYVVTDMMRSVIESGTARRARVLERPLAGKTGTSNASRNVWFSGFSTQLVATVWVGFDDNRPMGRATGSSAALPIWIQFMQAALNGTPPTDFPRPEGVETAPIDPGTGTLTEAGQGREEVFIEGTAPTEQSQTPPSIFLQDEAPCPSPPCSSRN